ncbi:hypothetical protein EON64_02830 [archaeon]|nr:MAG: hypothetical protein EON64_02830 [archaeon]
MSQGRTSSNAWCTGPCETSPIVQGVFRKIEEVTGVPRSHYESFQVATSIYIHVYYHRDHTSSSLSPYPSPHQSA